MDDQGDAWPVDSTLNQAPVPARVSSVDLQNEKLPQNNVSRFHGDLLVSDGDAVDVFEKPLLHSASSSYSDLSQDTRLPELFNLPWECVEALPDDPLAALPGLLDLEPLGDDVGEELSAGFQESSSYSDPVSFDQDNPLPSDILSMQATESLKEQIQDCSPPGNDDTQGVETALVSAGEVTSSSSPSQASLTCSSTEAGQSCSMQVSLLSNSQHCRDASTSDCISLTDQANQDFNSRVASVSDSDTGRAEDESQIKDDFSLNHESQTLIDSDNCIKSTDLTEDLTGDADNAQSCHTSCTSSSSVDGEPISGVEAAIDSDPSSPVSPNDCNKDTTSHEFPFDGQSNSPCQDTESQLTPNTSCGNAPNIDTAESDSCDESEKVHDCVHNELELDEQDTCSIHNSSPIMTSAGDGPSQDVSESSDSVGDLISNTLDKKSTESADLDDNLKTVPSGSCPDVGSREKDVTQDSGSSCNIFSPESTQVDADHADDSNSSESSGESVLLISDIECDAEVCDNEKKDIPVPTKIKIEKLDEEYGDDELFEREKPDSTTCDQDEQGETCPDARSVDCSYERCQSSEKEHLKPRNINDFERQKEETHEGTDEEAHNGSNKNSSAEVVTYGEAERTLVSTRETEISDLCTDPDVEPHEMKEGAVPLPKEIGKTLEECGLREEDSEEVDKKLEESDGIDSQDEDDTEHSDKDKTECISETSTAAGLPGKDCASDADDKDDPDRFDISQDTNSSGNGNGVDAESQEHQAVDTEEEPDKDSQERDNNGHEKMLGTAAESEDIQDEVIRIAEDVIENITDDDIKKDEDHSIKLLAPAVSDDTKSDQNTGDCKQQEAPIVVSDSDDDSSSSRHLSGSVKDSSLSGDMPVPNDNSDSSPAEKETAGKSDKTDVHVPEKDPQQDNCDDDVLIIEEDPEVISVGSSDEDEASEKSVCEPTHNKQGMVLRSRVHATPAPRETPALAKKQPVKKTNFECHMCGENNKSLNSLKIHVRRVHNLIMVHKKEDMKCKLCPYKGTWQNIKEHIIKDHKTPLKWYVKNQQQSREITKLPQSVSASEDASQKQSSKSDGKQSQSSATSSPKQHYLIKRVTNINAQPATSASSPRKMPTAVSSSLSVSASPRRTGTCSTSQPSLITVKSGKSVTIYSRDVNQQLLPGQNSNAKKPLLIIRQQPTPGVTKTSPTAGQNSIASSQSGFSNTQVFLSNSSSPRTISVMQNAGTVSTAARVVHSISASTTSSATQSGAQRMLFANKVIQPTSQKVVSGTQPISQKIVHGTSPGQQHQLLGGPRVSGVTTVLGRPPTVLSKVAPIVTPMSVNVTEVPQQNGQKVLRFVTCQSVLGKSTPFKMSAAEALINSARLRKSTTASSAPVISTAAGNKPKHHLSVIKSLLDSGTNTSSSVKKAPLPLTRVAQFHSSKATSQQAQTVTTPSSGLVTSSEISPKITVQHTTSEGDLMVSYVIKVPRSITDSTEGPSSTREKEEDFRSFLVKVPVNRTSAPKKFVVHLPVDKGSSVKHAVCIVQPPASEVGGIWKSNSAVQGKIMSSVHVSSPNKMAIPQLMDCRKSLLVQKISKDNSPDILPLISITGRGDQSRRAECLAHLQEPAVDIKLLESQFKDTGTFKAADLINVDCRVQYECARCKEAFPHLMLLQLHHIDCTTLPPSHTVLPITHIPTALLAAFFLASESGYSSLCAVCKVPVLGSPRNVEDQQDFANHLAQHAEPHVAITCLDDTRKLGIPQTRMTSQQAKEWVDFIVPPFKMFNKPTSSWDGSLEEYVCTETSLHKESLIRKRRKRSLPSELEKHKKSKKHKKHHKEKTREVTHAEVISIDDVVRTQRCKPYNSSLKTAEGCEGEWTEPSPTDSSKLYIRRKPRPGGLKESIMKSPTHPKLMSPSMQGHSSKQDRLMGNKSSPSKVSQRFMSMKIPGRRSLRGLGLDFGQGLMMLPMNPRKRKKVEKSDEKERATEIETKKTSVKDPTPSSSTIVGDDELKKSGMPVKRHLKERHSNSAKAQKTNLEAQDEQCKDIIVISSSDDEDSNEVMKTDGAETNEKMADSKTDLRAADIEEPDGDESDSKDADFSDNSDVDDKSSSDDENADEHQSDTDDSEGEIEEDGVESSQRDIPLTMMALHYQRLNEEMVKSDQEDEGFDNETMNDEHSDNDNSQNEKRDASESQTTSREVIAEEIGNTAETKVIEAEVSGRNLKEDNSSSQLNVTSAPCDNDSNSSDNYRASERSNSNSVEDGVESSQRDIPLTMMALHYQRLNEEMVKSDQEDEGFDNETMNDEHSDIDNSQNEKRDASESQKTSGEVIAEEIGNTAETKVIGAEVSGRNLKEDNSSSQLNVTSAPCDNDSNSSDNYRASERSNSNSVYYESSGDSNSQPPVHFGGSQLDDVHVTKQVADFEQEVDTKLSNSPLPSESREDGDSEFLSDITSDRISSHGDVTPNGCLQDDSSSKDSFLKQHMCDSLMSDDLESGNKNVQFLTDNDAIFAEEGSSSNERSINKNLSPLSFDGNSIDADNLKNTDPDEILKDDNQEDITADDDICSDSISQEDSRADLSADVMFKYTSSMDTEQEGKPFASCIAENLDSELEDSTRRSNQGETSETAVITGEELKDDSLLETCREESNQEESLQTEEGAFNSNQTDTVFESNIKDVSGITGSSPNQTLESCASEVQAVAVKLSDVEGPNGIYSECSLDQKHRGDTCQAAGDTFLDDGCLGETRVPDETDHSAVDKEDESADDILHASEEETDDDEDDDVICLIDDSDEEGTDSPITTGDRLFEEIPTSVSPSADTSTSVDPSGPPATSGGSTSEKLESLPEEEVSESSNLKRKSVADCQDCTDKEEEEEESSLKRFRGGQGFLDSSQSDSWHLLDIPQESDGDSDSGTVWKKDSASNVFSLEEFGQLRAGGL